MTAALYLPVFEGTLSGKFCLLCRGVSKNFLIGGKNPVKP